MRPKRSSTTLPSASAPVTLTLNPAIDQTILLRDFALNSLNRAHGFRQSAGGKGVNVSRMLAGLGIESIATGFLGHDNDRIHRDMLQSLEACDRFISIDGSTRRCLKIVDQARGTTTEINLPGAAPSTGDLQRLVALLEPLAAPSRWIILAGSLPPGVSLQWLETLIGKLKRRGAFIAIDTSGPALQRAVQVGVDLVKPNQRELECWAGSSLPSAPTRLSAARELHRLVPHVLASFGGEGAYCLAPDGALAISSAPIDAVNLIGAGDALLAGYLAGLVTDQSSVQRAKLAAATAWFSIESLDPPAIDHADIPRRMDQITVSQL